MSDKSILDFMGKLVVKLEDKIQYQRQVVDVIVKIEGDNPQVNRKEYDQAIQEMKALLSVKNLIIGEVIDSLGVPTQEKEVK